MKKSEKKDTESKNVNIRWELLRANYLLTGNLRDSGIKAGYSENYIRAHHHDLLARLEADPEVIEKRSKIQEEAEVTYKTKRDLLWKIANQATQAVPVLDFEGEETGEFRFDAKGAVLAIAEMNRMDGDHATIKVKHSGKLKHGHGIDPDALTNDQLDNRITELLRKAGAGEPPAGAGNS